jgi:transposase
MRFYTKQHPLYCGIDVHARTMYVCMLDHHGAILLHRTMPARPETFRKAIAPYRDDLGGAVECMFPWYWLADLCTRAGIPCVLGHALSMQAMHGGKAKNDTIDAPKIAVLRRGGMRPQASGSPAAMRATRDLLRRRMHLMRTRAARLAHIQHTTSQDHLPELGQKLASKGKRDGVAARCREPAVPKSVEVDLALIDHDDRLRRDVALTLVQTAKPPHAHALSRLPSVPGIGKLLRVVWLYAMHEITRLPRVQDVVSSCRLVKCAQESAGKRYGTSGKKLGHASLNWAFAAAAVLLLRHNPPGQTLLARMEKKHGQGQALTIWAHKLARAVSSMLTRDTVFAMDRFLNGSGRRVGEPAASLDP